MVRRGSTVRVRQRALQKPRITGLFASIDLLQVLERGAGMEPFIEPSGRKRLLESASRDRARGHISPTSARTALPRFGNSNRRNRRVPAPEPRGEPPISL